MQIKGIDERFAIYGMLFSLSNRVQTCGDKKMKEKAVEDITMKQHFMMSAMQLFGETAPTLKEVGDAIGCSYQNVKRMAINLEKGGYLTIESDADDKRKVRLKGTGKFEELENYVADETMDFMQTLYKGISKEQLEITLQTLMAMDRNIGGELE